ncbi:MAG: apolipoprotein N-acyltransferase [Planctomycetaceae bacterium]|nr:apolipoprotein N-acyltransferase [Planctomycetaceae bacterium]
MKAITQSSFFWIFLGGLCYYLALPPLNVAPLALASPICWGIAILRNETKIKRYVFPTAYLFWLASIWWVACPYPPYTAIGLFALAAVLALFWLLFFASARVAVHRYRIPLTVAMPLCWLGTEYIRCRFLGGFSFCAIEHAFYLYPPLIQLASIGGSLLLGGIIMFLGAAAVSICSVSAPGRETQNRCRTGSAANGLVLIFTILIIIGASFTIQRIDPNDENYTPFSIVALQGNRQVYIDGGQTEANKTFQQFLDLIHAELNHRVENGIPLPDLIVFPETVCPIPLFAFEGTTNIDDLGLHDDDREMLEDGRWFREFAQNAQTAILFGLSTWVYGDTLDSIRLNSALFVRPQYDSHSLSAASSCEEHPAKMLRYDKMHLVLLGEYVPFAEYLPDDFFLRTLCHEARHGTEPLAVPIGRGDHIVEAAVNICFESTVAHLIRQQILTLRHQGHDPRILINLSNDGWFRFSRAIEQHLATHIFRAVENRKYYVTATNGGYSAIINPYGEIRAKGERGGAEAVSGLVSVNLNGPQALTFYQVIGDWYALPFAVLVVLLASVRARGRRSGNFELGDRKA